MGVESDLFAVTPQVRPVDLSESRRVHVIGAGGAGMRAIARVLLAMGHRVSGSDRADSKHLQALERAGAQVWVGSDVDRISDVDFVTRSTAVPDTDAEVEAARSRAIPVLARAEVLAAISRRQPSILVAGTHGKTTTSSMLASILESGGRSPSFIIGSDVARFGTGARWLPDTEMIIEADESDGTFLVLEAAHAIVTSLDPDHLEYYGGRDLLDAAFGRFVDQVDGMTAVCIDDADTGPLVERPGVVTYGTDARADLRILDLEHGRDHSTCRLEFRGRRLGAVRIGLPGIHNALNAAGAAVIALELGIDARSIAQGLSEFGGVARRFEQRGRARGVTFIDDYAHLPAEVEAAIATAQAGGWRRVVATYQPHRFSRTEALGHTFAESFAGVDELILTGIYPSGEAPRPGVTGRIVYDAVVAACPDLEVTYCETLTEVSAHLGAHLEPGDLCLTLGAGDLTTVPDRVIAALHTRWLADLDARLTNSAVHVDEPLGARTTYRVGGHARALIEVGSRGDLVALAAECSKVLEPILVVGRGSNMLVSDAGFDGVAVVLTGEFERVEINQAGVVSAGAAVPLPALARQSVAAGFAGFEWAVGVPGTIGGAVVMNAGGHGSDMAASVIDVEVLDLSTGAASTLTAADLGFGYRSSAIGPDQVVLGARLQLSPGDEHASRALLAEIVRWRRENQPGGQNAGSVFTNPPGDSAGRLIDAAGGKGMRIGTAEVSTKHANFIQVDPDGSADDVLALMRDVAALVRADSGVVLEPETRLVGFADDDPAPEPFIRLDDSEER